VQSGTCASACSFDPFSVADGGGNFLGPDGRAWVLGNEPCRFVAADREKHFIAAAILDATRSSDPMTRAQAALRYSTIF